MDEIIATKIRSMAIEYSKSMALYDEDRKEIEKHFLEGSIIAIRLIDSLFRDMSKAISDDITSKLV